MTKDVRVFAGDINNLKDKSVTYPLKGFFGRNRAKFYTYIGTGHIDFNVLATNDDIATTDLVIVDKDLDSFLFLATSGENDEVLYAVIDLTQYQSKLPMLKGTLELDLCVYDGMYGNTADELCHEVQTMFDASTKHDMEFSARFLGNPHEYIVTAVDPVKRKVTVKYNSTYAGDLPVDQFCIVYNPGYYGPTIDVVRKSVFEKLVWSPSKSMVTNKYQKLLDGQEQIIEDLSDIFINHKYDKCELVSQPEAEDKNYLMRLVDKSNVFVSTNKGEYIFQRGALIDSFAKRIFK